MPSRAELEAEAHDLRAKLASIEAALAALDNNVAQNAETSTASEHISCVESAPALILSLGPVSDLVPALALGPAPAIAGKSTLSHASATVAGGAQQVTVPTAALEAFLALKRRRHRFVTFAVDERTFELRVDKSAPPTVGGAEILRALPATHARYAVIDHEYLTRDGRRTSKIFCLLWTPLGAVGRDNMLYASQRRMLDAAFTGVEDAQCSSMEGVAKLLGLTDHMPDEDEEEWDPDA